MPRYNYQCECGLQFEASQPATKAKDPTKCAACGKMASRLMPTDLNGVFNAPVNGPGPQNTGIHSLDTHIDRVIGQSAQQGWAAEDARRAEKRRVLRNTPGASSADLSLNPDGSYRVRKPEEKAVHDRAVAINVAAQEALKKKAAQ